MKRTKRRLLRILAAVVLIAAVAALVWGWSFISESPFEGERVFQSPSFVYAEDEGRLLVIDSSLTRVSVLSAGSREVEATIRGGDFSDTGFYYAQYVMTDGESVYVADVTQVSGGNMVETERILRYSLSGRYRETVFRIDYQYSDMPGQYGNIVYLDCADGGLYFMLKCAEGVKLYTIENGRSKLLRTAEFDGAAYIYQGTYNRAQDSIAVTTKDGRLYTEQGGKLTLALDMSQSRGDSIPYGLFADGAGQVFYTDIGLRELIRLSDGSPLLDASGAPEERPTYYKPSCTDGGVIGCTDFETVTLLDTEGGELWSASAVGYTGGYAAARLLVWLALALIALAAVYAVVRAVMAIFKSGKSSAFKTALLLGFVIIITTVFVSLNIFGSTTGRVNTKSMYNLTQIATSISDSSDRTFGDEFETLKTLGDYRSEAYYDCRGYLDVFCDTAYANDTNLYYALYREEDGYVYAVMDYEDTLGVIYPYVPYADSGYDYVMETGQVVTIEAESNSYGYWAYAMGPIRNAAGDVVGVVEIGTNMHSEQLQNEALVRDIVISTIVLVLVILLLLSEATAFVDCLGERRRLRAEGARDVPEFLRPIAFLMFFAQNFSSAFLPQLSDALFVDSGWGVSASLGSAIPMSAQLLFVAIMAICSGAIIDRAGIRKVLIAGLAVQIVGDVVVAFAVSGGSYSTLVLGEIINGCGMGAAVVSFNSTPTSVADEERCNRLIAQLNVGMTAGIVIGAAIGSYLAESLGYFATFICSGVVLIPTALLVALNFSGAMRARRAEGEGAKRGMSPLRFLFSPRVISFLLFLMFPFLVMLYFKDYLFPLFANSRGYSDSQIGNILLFGGVLSIYLAEPLSNLCLKYLKAKGSMIVSSVAFIAALTAFALFPSLTVAIVAVMVLTVAGYLGIASQGMYYAATPQVALYGSGKAMGMCSLFDNLGQTVGPLLFGVLLVSGYSRACWYVVFGAAALLVLFLLINLLAGRRERRTAVSEGK